MSESGRRADPPEGRRATGDAFSFVEDDDTADVLGWMAFADSRSDRRAERRRRFRARLITLGVVLGLVVAGTGGWFIYGAVTSASASADARDSILLQVADPEGNAIASALLVVDPGRGTAVALAVPGGLDVNVTGQGIVPFGQALGQLGATGCRQALSDLLGVQIGGSWDLTAVSFANLIDQASGVEVTVDTPFKGIAGPIAAGHQTLSGADATLFADQQVPSQPPTAQTGRFLQVLTSLFNRLVPGQTAAAATLSRIGMVPDPSLSQAQLASTLPGFVAAAQNQKLTASTLPVVPAPNGTGTYSLDVASAAPMVHQLLGGTVGTVGSGGPPRVLLEDGTDGALAPGAPSGLPRAGNSAASGAAGTGASASAAGSASAAAPSASATAGVSGSSSSPTAASPTAVGGTSWPTLDSNAQTALTGAGLVVVDGGRASGRVRAHSLIQIDDAGKHAAADEVAQALGLTDSAVQVVSAPMLTDVVVVLGEDYQG